MAHYTLEDLLKIMAQLRGSNGCNWDKAQTFASLAPYAIEEAHEVAEVIAEQKYHLLADELGDLLLQVVFQSQIASEQGLFSFADVVQAISEKMVRRHPHVFNEQQDLSPEQVSAQWALIKAQEPSTHKARRYLLEHVATGQPALTRAEKLQKQASKVGFDWHDPNAVIAKLREELDEVEDAIAHSPATIAEELGDLLFCVVNLARHLRVDAEQCLKLANSKFTRRFNFIEDHLQQQDKTFSQTNLIEMEQLWQLAKQAESDYGTH
ncbi:nucleoside triphosphate pyrophosphohydrolase [Agitococcus lubricus]|uniref:Nucleoside triphosphate pyrophosphohydrolase n=1 Tax=Agitococcus lubricus TaxID=1077255 RepID=A0A2T5IVF1_9GAMM|nr:nucleoside triphosphate pyrophosphohydrolase [Agitococcus lubricus]PTQ87860.1 ATP diphosphatase [Agitococcus lubricus]